MDALILSCATGGGHHAAAAALYEELLRRGHHAVRLDPYTLVGNGLEKRVGNGYIQIAQRTPRLFGAIYRLGDAYRRLPVHSPVYALNGGMQGKMQEYLETHHYDVILMTHLYPGEILTYMKNHGVSVPPMIFVATDYVCVPFTEEIDCDAYVTPAPMLNADFVRRGIPEKRLFAAGIPVSHAFGEKLSRASAAAALGLDPGLHYLLLSGGSIGAGMMERAVGLLRCWLDGRADRRLIVVCGSNVALLDRLRGIYADDDRLILLGSTDRMAMYLRVCDAFLSKPGGLSSTEAAVSGVPLIHLAPIPGCENLNMDFFSRCGMSVAVGRNLALLPAALEKTADAAFAGQMRENQRKYINASAAADICAFAEGLAASPGTGK